MCTEFEYEPKVLRCLGAMYDTVYGVLCTPYMITPSPSNPKSY